MTDRTKAPNTHEITLPVIPAIQEVKLPNGVQSTLLNQGTQPVVLLEIVIPIGRHNEPIPGISYYLAKMLTEGTKARSSEEIASVFDFYGSHLEVSPTLDSIHIKLYTLTKFFQELSGILLELLQESIFPEREFEVVKNIRIQQILQQHARNNAYAGLKFRESLFGVDHPYGEIISVEKARKISIDDLRQFSGALLARPEIFLAGLVGDREIKILSDRFGQADFGYSLKAGTFQSAKGTSEKITREDSTQASIKHGDYTISRSHADTHKLKITNSLLGGFFGSRLMKNIREEKGLTYGIHSSVVHLKDASYWQVSTEVLRDKVELARTEITNEIVRLQDTPPSADELDTVLNYLKGKLLTTFDTPFNTMNVIKNVKLAGLDAGYFEAYQNTLLSISGEDISEMAAKYIDTENAIWTTVQ